MPTKTPVATDPYAVPQSASADPYAQAVTDPYAQSAAADYSVKNDKTAKEGVYRMRGVNGIVKPVPYSNVILASKDGWRIHPDDLATYKNDRFAEIKKSGGQLELPQAYDIIKATPPIMSPAWLKQQAYNNARRGVDALPTIGATTFGLVAGVPGAATGPGDIAIVAGAGAAGAAGGEAAKEEINERVFGEPRMTPKKAALNIGGQAALGAGSAVVSQYVGAGLQKAGQYFADTALASRAAGIPLLPSQAIGEEAGVIERRLKGSVITGKQMARFRMKQNANAQAVAVALADKIAGPSAQPWSGMAVQDAIKAEEKKIAAQQATMYDAIDNAVREKITYKNVPQQVTSTILAPNGQPAVIAVNKQVATLTGPAMPSMAGLKDFAKQELKKLAAEEDILDPALLSSTKNMLQKMANAPDNVTFRGMFDARSDLLSITRDQADVLADKKIGMAKKLASLADEAMVNAARESGIPGLEQELRAANLLTAEKHRVFEQTLIENIAKSDKPENIARLIRGSTGKSGATVGIDETKDLMKMMPPPVRQKVQAQIIKDTINDATHQGTGRFSEMKFATQIKSIGDDRGTAIFGSNWKNIKELSDVLIKIGNSRGGDAGASLHNWSVIKTPLYAAAALVVGLGTGAGVIGGSKAGVITGLATAGTEIGTVGLQAVFEKTLATALTHPEMTAKMLRVLEPIARYGSYAPMAGADLAIGSSGRPKYWTHTATNADGHKLGSHDGENWFDFQTGQPISKPASEDK